MIKSKFNIFVKNENKILLFNTYTLALVELDDNTYNNFLNDKLSDDEISAFKSIGAILDIDNEIDILEHKYNKEKYSTDTLNLTVKLTNDCNYRCTYCYQEHIHKNMNIENAKILIKFIENKISKGYKFINIHWFGGEPLLNQKVMFFVEDFLIRNNINGYSDVTTNGYYIDDKFISKLKNTRINNFQLTLDGYKNYHDEVRILPNKKGTFDLTINSIKKLVENKYFVTLRINISKNTEKNYYELLKYIKDLELNEDYFGLYGTETTNFELSQNKDNFYYSNLLEYSKSYVKFQNTFYDLGMKFCRPTLMSIGCPFSGDSCYMIEPDLKLCFCTSSDNNGEFLYGLIDENGEENIDMNNYLNRIKYSPFKDEKCLNCKILPLCMGGCPLKNFLGKEACIPERYSIEDYVKLLYKEAITEYEQKIPFAD